MRHEPKARIIGPRTLKTSLAFLVVFITYNIIGRDYDPTLACLAVLVCMEDSVARSIKNGINRVFGTLLGACLGYIYTMIQPANRYLQSAVIALGVLLLISGCSLLARTNYISMAVITFINIAVFYSAEVSSTLSYVSERMFSTLLGIVVAIIINRFLFNPDTHAPLPKKDGVVYRLNGAHYLHINGERVLITNCDYSLSSEFEQGEDKRAKTALSIMLQCARRDGVEITVLAGFRPYVEQRRRKTKKLPSPDPHLALAGHSEHGAGLAYDLGSGDPKTDFTMDFELTEQYRWLKQNAAYYGFIERYPRGKIAATGFEFEPWHYRYVGPDTALFIQSTGKALEEFIKPDTDGEEA